METSPTFKKSDKTITFAAALTRMVGGANVKRVSWPDGSFGYIGTDGFLMLSLEDGPHFWKLEKVDITANDWIVVNNN